VTLQRYSEFLSDGDYAVLSKVVASNTTFSKLGFRQIKNDPELLEYLLASEDLYRSLFGPDGEPLLQVSPFLGFAVLIHRSAIAISKATFVTEWIGPRKRVPLFDTRGAKRILHDPSSRFFLAELLASFTHVSSGTLVRPSAKGLRKKRFSELDLASLVDIASDADELARLQIVKRIGDLCLLLAGVFPDYAGTMIDRSPRYRAAVKRALVAVSGGDKSSRDLDTEEVLGADDGLRVLESLASSCYSYLIRSNIASAASARDALETLERIASDSEAVRRALNFVSDRYLFDYRSSWFGLPN